MIRNKIWTDICPIKITHNNPNNRSFPTSARLAQSVEHETLNLRVVGSSPTLGELFLVFIVSLLKKIVTSCNIVLLFQFSQLSPEDHHVLHLVHFLLLHANLVCLDNVLLGICKCHLLGIIKTQEYIILLEK